MMPMPEQTNPGPKGDAVAVGTINTRGLVSLSMYLPDGGRASFSGSILHGDLVALRALSSTRGTGSVMLGAVDMLDTSADRDFGGSLRFYAPTGIPGSLYQVGFSQTRSVSGARYAAPPRNVLPLRGFTTTQFNSLFNLQGGEFSGISKVGTWGVNSTIAIPAAPFDRATASFNRTTGLLSYTQTLSDVDRGLVNARATGFAVHQQLASEVLGSAVVRGYYVSAFSNGGLFVTPNDGRIPELTLISPPQVNFKRAAQQYTIEVRANGPWEVVLPFGATWVTAEVVGAAAETPLSGTGNGTVTVTLLENNNSFTREVVIDVAGVPHRIRQDYRAQ
jgi:hypothetical protein